jgi:putative hydrolase of the HAD superfamily
MTRKVSLTTVLFVDFGNVVGHFDHTRTTSKLAAHSNLSADAIFRQLYLGQLEMDFESGQMSTEQFFARAVEACGLRCSKEEFLTAYCDIFSPNDEVCQAIPTLAQSCRLLLASNTTPPHAAQFTQQFAAPLQHFSGWALSFALGARKPTPLFYTRSAALANANPSDCVLLDDLSVNVAGAKKAGWNAVLYTPGGSWRRELEQLGIYSGG